MFYLTSKFHDNSVNTFESIEMGAPPPHPSPQARELRESPGGIGLDHQNLYWKDKLAHPRVKVLGREEEEYGFSIRLEKFLLLIGWVTITSLRTESVLLQKLCCADAQSSPWRWGGLSPGFYGEVLASLLK